MTDSAENDATRCWALVNGNPCEVRGSHDAHRAVDMRGRVILPEEDHPE